MIKIAIDCMGGDHGLPVTLPAALLFRDRHPDTQILLVGLADQIESHLLKLKASRDRIEVIPATDVVTMEDSVEIALRKKKDSSMRVAANLVKDGAADACVSAGNTGAWMAISRYVLKTIEGIDRPAIATAIPNQKGVATVLDLGANVDCSAEHLLQFAIMGSALSSAVDHVANPSVGLLNIGEEVIKGNDVVKQAGELLRQTPQLNFYGNVEGDDIYKGTVDVVVCDGFVGNVFLKSSEGLARMVGGFLLDEFKRNAFSYFLAFLALPVLNRFKKRVDHRRYNGAALLGLRGVVIKSHGSADSYAFGWALSRARSAVQSNMLAKISASVAQTYERLQPVLDGASAEENHETNTDLAKKEEQ